MKINFTPNVMPSHHLARRELIGAALLDVRYAPMATKFGSAAKCRDVPQAKVAQLFDRLGGAHEERRRDRESERFGGSHVDDEVEARGTLKR